MSVFAPSIASLYLQTKSYGIDPDPLFLDEGITPSVIFDSSARVDYNKTDRVASAAAKLSGDPFFGLKEADYFRPAHLGALGFAWLASSTLRTALQRLTKFSSLVHSEFSVALSEQDNLLNIDFFNPRASQAPRIRDDGVIGVMVRMCRIIHGPGLNPHRVESVHEEPEDSSYYFEYFKCPVTFGSEYNRVSFLLGDVDKRLAGADEQLAMMNDHIVVKYLAHRQKNDVVNRVKTAILELIAEGDATEQATACYLNVSTRNLNRKLSEEKTSFRQLLNETRQELAEQYINDHTLTLTEISFLLGFSEASSFSRAYKRWTGVSPSDARADRAPGYDN